MTYGKLKSLTRALLIGDNTLPKGADELLGLLEYAYLMVSNKAEALHLLTMNQNDDINRRSVGDWLSRTPELPNSDDDELDIDKELGFAVARYIASFISKDKPAVHENEAKKVIDDYNSKVHDVLANAVQVVEGEECVIK